MSVADDKARWAVLIPTLADAVRVVDLSVRTPSTNQSQAFVMANGGHDHVASEAYRQFVEPTMGPIETIQPSEAGRIWRLDLDRAFDVDAGASWRLGVALAHALAREGRLAAPDDPDARLVAATGRVTDDLRVLGVDHVLAKAEMLDANGALARCAMFLCPSANVVAAKEAATVRDAPMRLVDDFAQARKLLGLEAPRPAPEAKPPIAFRRRFEVAALTAAAALVAWPAHDYGKDLLKPGPEPAPPQLGVIALRPPAGQTSCVAVRDGAAPATAPAPLSGARFATAEDGRATAGQRPLCGLAFAVSGAGDLALSLTPEGGAATPIALDARGRAQLLASDPLFRQRRGGGAYAITARAGEAEAAFAHEIRVAR